MPIKRENTVLKKTKQQSNRCAAFVKDTFLLLKYAEIYPT